MLDILITFRTTYVNQKTTLEITDPKLIALNYPIKGRFLLDLFSVLPLESFFPDDGSGGSNKQLKLLGLLKLIRLLRLGRIITYMKFK